MDEYIYLLEGEARTTFLALMEVWMRYEWIERGRVEMGVYKGMGLKEKDVVNFKTYFHHNFMRKSVLVWVKC